MNSLKELYAYREMIFSLVRKDLRTRYKGSRTGIFMDLCEPLAAVGGIHLGFFHHYAGKCG